MADGVVRTFVTMDKAGRVVLPKRVRDELRLLPGDTLDLTLDSELSRCVRGGPLPQWKKSEVSG